MDVIDAIKERKSYRAFKPDRVPLDLLKKIMEQALWAPSWANTQPWEFAVASGKKLKEIQEGFVKKGMQDPYSEVARPPGFPEPYMGRIRALQPKDRGEMTREEMEARFMDNFRHYGATTCIYLLVGKNFFQQPEGMNVWALYDSGSAVQNIMLLATNYGLGTVAQAQAVVYPDIIRKVLKIPEDKLIALGIAIGYPDLDNPVNQSRTTREPMEEVVKFFGFD
jgi:nitroreductase